jgi:hypothetical protein
MPGISTISRASCSTASRLLSDESVPLLRDVMTAILVRFELHQLLELQPWHTVAQAGLPEE